MPPDFDIHSTLQFYLKPLKRSWDFCLWYVIVLKEEWYQKFKYKPITLCHANHYFLFISQVNQPSQNLVMKLYKYIPMYSVMYRHFSLLMKFCIILTISYISLLYRLDLDFLFFFYKLFFIEFTDLVDGAKLGWVFFLSSSFLVQYFLSHILTTVGL